jgi:hypothetical protein
VADLPSAPPCPVDPACRIDHTHATLNLNRTRRDLLRAVAHRRVTAANGIILRRTDGERNLNLNRRCDAAVRELEAAGWVRLGDVGTYELTEVGRDVLDGAR